MKTTANPSALAGEFTAAQAAIVAARDVSRTYDGGRIQALAGVSLAIAAGESISLTGASGSGKSTLLNLLAGMEQPSSGQVLVDGCAPPTSRAWAEVRARRLGIVFQSFNLFPILTAQENVEIPMFGVVASSAERRTRALALLEEVGLADRARHRPSELSGGERQRVAIARSLANSPAVLLADEPTGSLDSKNANAVLDLMFKLHERRGMALLIVTHDAGVAGTARRQLTMHDGRIESDAMSAA